MNTIIAQIQLEVLRHSLTIQTLLAFDKIKEEVFPEDTLVYCGNENTMTFLKEGRVIECLKALEPYYTVLNCHTWNNRPLKQIVVFEDGRTSKTYTGKTYLDFYLTEEDYKNLIKQLSQ